MSELGNKLRDARVDKGYTLNTLQQLTKIQKKYLTAIEEGQFAEMPGNFYTRAFIKQYAETVGLDGDALLLEYEEELAAAELQGNLAVQREEEPALPSRLARSKEQQDFVAIDRFAKYAPFVVLGAVVLVIMFFILMAIRKAGQSDLTPVSSESTSIVASVSPESAASIATSQSQESVEEDPEGTFKVGTSKMVLTSSIDEETTYRLLSEASSYDFEVRGIGVVWVGIFEDDRIVIDTTIAEGETLSYKLSANTKEVRIRLGYPEGATFYVNGTEVAIDSQYVTDSIRFLVEKNDISAVESSSVESSEAEELAETVTEPATEPAAETTSESTYQGPAVLDPSRSRSNE